MAQKSPTFYLHTTVHRFESMVELTGMNSYNDLVTAVTKILGIPETHNFRESYTLEVIDFSDSGANRRRTIVTDANFDKMKDKTKLHVIERVSKEEACVPVDYEVSSEYIGIHLKHASFNTPPKFPNIYVSFVMKKKPFRQSVSSIKVNNNLPVWNENFLLPLLLDHDAVEKDRLSDAIIVKVVSTTEDKADLTGAPTSTRELPSKSKDKEKDKASEDVKEAILTKFEVQLLHLKKGEPMVFKIDFKTGFVIVDMLWFEDNRSIDLTAVYQDQGKNKHVSHAVTGGAFFFLPPPKDSYGKTGKRQEIQWFCDLQGMNSVDSLKKGDILLGKFFLSNPIIEIQENIQATKGSKYSCHVAIACEDGAYCIAESSVNRRCVSISPFFPEADFLVYRAVDQAYAKEAADWAFDIATNYDIKYSIENLRAAMSDKKEDGPSHAQVVSRLKFDVASHQGGNLNASRKKVPQTMMEGQFVVMAYQSKSTPYIKVSSLYISPMEFEDYLNQNPELFYFVGKITEGQCKQYNDEHNLKNTYDCNVLSTRAQEVASHLNFERKKEIV